jgi:hypothetical protein
MLMLNVYEIDTDDETPGPTGPDVETDPEPMPEPPLA